MRVLVTGIDGFVGSHTAEFLLAIPDVEVFGTVLDPALTFNIKEIEPSVSLYTVDLIDRDRLISLVEQIKPDRIIHLAGQAFVPTAFADPSSTFQVNIMGGVNVLDAARILGVKTGVSPSVLVVSTGEVYGKVDRSPITEDFPLSPNNPYAASKASIDLIAQQYRTSFGLPAIVVRPFNHAGPRQSPLFVCSDFGKQFAEIAAGKRPPELHVGNIHAQRDFTDVRDVVKAYWLLLERAAPDVVYNVCSGQPLAIEMLLSMFQEIAGLKVSILSEKHRMRSYDVPVVTGSYHRLKQATGWEPVIPLRETLVDVYEYWRRHIG
jgi:GDP-4-dehydro-6-deoxy-D-mannose reductase